jgi:outer membrane protein assembly factor BamB
MCNEVSIARRDLLKAVAAAAALIPGLPGTAAPRGAADWPCFRGPNHNGVIDQKFTPLAGGPRKAWEAAVGPGHASMAVVGGRLYTLGSRPENLVCLDARTGDRIWARTLDTWSGDSTPAFEGGRLYAMPSMQFPTAYCCDAADGRTIWKRDLPKPTGDRQYGHAGSPLLWEDLVILNAAGGAALKKASGEVAWLHEGFPGLATPVIYESKGRKCVGIFGGDQLLARDARSGALLWTIPWKTSLAVNACDPIFFDDKVLVCSNYGLGRALYDISGQQPKVVWNFPQGHGSSFSSGFFHGGELYCFAKSKFACIDVPSGKPKWESEGGVSAILIGDTLVRLVPVGAFSLARLTASGCRQFAAGGADLKDVKCVPAYWNGKLYFRGENGPLVCYDIGEGAGA